MDDIVVVTQIWRDENGVQSVVPWNFPFTNHFRMIFQTNDSSKTLPGSIRGLVTEHWPLARSFSGRRLGKSQWPRWEKNVCPVCLVGQGMTNVCSIHLIANPKSIICCYSGWGSKHMASGLFRIWCNAWLIKYDDASTGLCSGHAICHNECLRSQ